MSRSDRTARHSSARHSSARHSSARHSSARHSSARHSSARYSSVAIAFHWSIAVLVIAMPVTGWLMVSGAETRRPLTWFGLFDIPYLPVSCAAAGGFGHDAHGLIGWPMLALVVLHAGAALRHHLILRDGVPARMAPVPDRG